MQQIHEPAAKLLQLCCTSRRTIAPGDGGRNQLQSEPLGGSSNAPPEPLCRLARLLGDVAYWREPDARERA